MIDNFTANGDVYRIDLHTGANLWLANHAVAITACLLSVIGSSSIILSFVFFRSLLNKGFHSRLVLYLSISDLLIVCLHGSDHSYNLASGRVVDNGFCQFTGWYVKKNKQKLILTLLHFQLSVEMINPNSVTLIE